MRGRWQAPDRPELGFVNGLGRLLRNAELTHPDCLPDLRSESLLLIGSDYSGQHKSSKYEALSFLIADWSKSNFWITKQKAIRKVLMPDGRRFGFKHMRDGIRRAALPHLLSAAESLTGLLLVVLVHKSVGKLFSANVDIADLDERTRPIANWPPLVLERAMCAATLVSVLLSGLSRQGQDVLWITDADDVVANSDRHRQFVNMFGNVSGNILEINLGHMRIATTASDEEGRGVEDFVAIPDLFAGTICDAMTKYQVAETRPGNRIITPLPEALRDTTRYLLSWWLSQGGALKRVAICIERGSSDQKVLLSQIHFSATSRPFS